MSSGSNPALKLRPDLLATTVARYAAVLFVLSCAVVASGCRDRKPAAGEVTEDDSPPASGDPAVLRVMLDGTVVARLTMAEVQKRPALSDLLPPEARDMHQWKLIEARAREPRYEYLALPKPTRNFPGQVPRLFVDRKGQVAFGMERGGDQPYFTTMRSGIKVVLVHTRAAGERPPSPGQRADLVVEVAGTEKTISPAQLDAIPKIPDADRDADGWYLRDVLALVTPVAGIAKVTLTAVDKTVEVDAAELTDDKLLAVVKITRRGQFRFKMWRLDADAGRSLVKDGREISRVKIDAKE